MNALQYLFAGFAIFWAGLFVYLLVLQARVRTLQHEIELLEERLTEGEADAAGRPTAREAATAQTRAPEQTPTGA